MALLDLLQNVALGINLREPTTVIGSADRQTKELHAICKEVLDDLKLWPWPELNRTHSFATVPSQASYTLPSDFNYSLIDTFWNTTEQWQLIGPLRPQEWQSVQHGVGGAIVDTFFRIKGIAGNQFFVEPVPSSIITISFEYASRNAIRPRTWAASQVYSAGAYTFYDGNYYRSTLGGSTGVTAPTHTTGSVSDGGVTWTYYSGLYESPTADTDEMILDQKLVEAGLQAFFLRSKRLEYADYFKQYEDQKRIKMNRSGARILCLDGAPIQAGLTFNIPDSV
jgi:hypothetical protein